MKVIIYIYISYMDGMVWGFGKVTAVTLQGPWFVFVSVSLGEPQRRTKHQLANHDVTFG